jgi:hypothetical protein
LGVQISPRHEKEQEIAVEQTGSHRKSLFCVKERSNLVDIAAVFISFLALVFTIFSFYWMNWRKAKHLIVGKPVSYAASAQKELLVVQLPLVFYNDGAATHIVSNLRLRLEQGGKEAPPLLFNNTVDDLSSNEGRKWARQFAVKGRDSYASVFVFQTSGSVDFQFSAGTCQAMLEGKLDNKDGWETVLKFDLHIAEDTLGTLHSNRLIAFDNDPSWKKT